MKILTTYAFLFSIFTAWKNTKFGHSETKIYFTSRFLSEKLRLFYIYVIYIIAFTYTQDVFVPLLRKKNRSLQLQKPSKFFFHYIFWIFLIVFLEHFRMEIFLCCPYSLQGPTFAENNLYFSSINIFLLRIKETFSVKIKKFYIIFL